VVVQAVVVQVLVVQVLVVQVLVVQVLVVQVLVVQVLVVQVLVLMDHVLGLRKILAGLTLLGPIRVDVALHPINAIRVEFNRVMGSNSPVVSEIARG
jgi:hypothetical protein